MRTLPALAVTLTLTLAGVAVATTTQAQVPAASASESLAHAAAPAAHARPAWSRTPCKAEDGPGPCYWDAGMRGNHRGHSYWIDSRQIVHYLDGRTVRLERRHGVIVRIG